MPLSEYEERMIAQFERQFDGSDPFAYLTAPEDEDHSKAMGSTRLFQFGVAGTVLGLVIMGLALGVSVPLAFAGFLLSFASCYWAVTGFAEGGWKALGANRRATPRRRSTDY